MKVLVKVGGTLLETDEGRSAIACQLASVAAVHELAVVHGGGKQVTRFLEERGHATRFVNGLRVSDAAVIDAVLNVLAGAVNKRLVSALVGAGLRPLGLSGLDGRLTCAVPLDSELGWVGRPVHTDPDLLRLLTAAGYTPVIACLAADANGAIYNVNADEMAASCASAWKAETLLFLTDVPGVKDREGGVIPEICIRQARELTECGLVSGGMQAKLRAATTALLDGVSEVRIASGTEPDVCTRLLKRDGLGTRLTARLS